MLIIIIIIFTNTKQLNYTLLIFYSFILYPVYNNYCKRYDFRTSCLSYLTLRYFAMQMWNLMHPLSKIHNTYIYRQEAARTLMNISKGDYYSIHVSCDAWIYYFLVYLFTICGNWQSDDRWQWPTRQTNNYIMW